jgi:hypothetical protein
MLISLLKGVSDITKILRIYFVIILKKIVVESQKHPKAVYTFNNGSFKESLLNTPFNNGSLQRIIFKWCFWYKFLALTEEYSSMIFQLFAFTDC